MVSSLDFPPIVESEDSLEAIQDFFETQGWTDGLPFIPPTRQRVKQMYDYVQGDPNDVLGVLGPRNGEATLERLATKAIDDAPLCCPSGGERSTGLGVGNQQWAELFRARAARKHVDRPRGAASAPERWWWDSRRG
jgi:hypothetical protein